MCHCVDDVIRLGGGALERVKICILAEWLKIEYFLGGHYQVENAVWFVNLVYTLTFPAHLSSPYLNKKE